MKDKFNILAIIGIIISINFSLYDKVSIKSLVFISIGILVFCYLLLIIENKLNSLNKRWLDSIFFFFTKRESSFDIIERNAEYCITDEKNATFKEITHLKCLKEGSNQTFTSRHAWDQEEAIECSKLGEGFTIKEEDDLKWTMVHMTSEGFMEKNSNWDAGFELKNLRITNYKKKSYISTKVVDKIKSLKMTIKINESFGFNKVAKLYVEDYVGRLISPPEDVCYDETNKCFFKELRYPRKGRKYIIKVFYN